MKPLFGSSKQTKENDTSVEDIFVTAKCSDELGDAYAAVTDTVFDEGAKQQKVLQREKSEKDAVRNAIGIWILSIGLLVVLAATGQLASVIAERFWVIAVLAAALIGYTVYALVLRSRRKRDADGAVCDKAEGDEATTDPTDFDYLFKDEQDPRIEEVKNKIYASFGVPDTAPIVDIIYPDYKAVDGEPVLKTQCKMTSLFNLGMKIFKDGESLCLADLDNRYDFPLNGLRSIETVYAPCKLTFWNKSTPHDEGRYALYEMKTDSNHHVRIDFYCILTMEKDGEVYGLYFPCYELPILKELTGVPVR